MTQTALNTKCLIRFSIILIQMRPLTTSSRLWWKTELRVARNDETIAAIDALFAEYSGQNDREALKRSDIIMKIENNNLHQLVDKKTLLIQENEELKKELTKYGSVVFMLNSPRLVMTADFLDKKSTIIPVTLVLLFVGFFWLKGLYLKGKEYDSAA